MGLLKTLVVFGVGFYCGIFANQNYNMPPIDNPKEILQKIQEMLKQYEKSNDKSD
jgi:hypothetical protein